MQPVRHNKTADKFFLQNQPVTARGINNKNFERVGCVGLLPCLPVKRAILSGGSKARRALAYGAGAGD